MILVIDHYDSFVYNLARYVRRLGADTHVVRCDAVDSVTLGGERPQAIILSPGPCTPAETGATQDIIRRWQADIPILGVCLGHQTIATACGGRVVRADTPVHGRASLVYHQHRYEFQEIDNPFSAGRYHSLVVEESSLPEVLEVTARAIDGTVMAIRHREHPLVGWQFHPESVLTPRGYQLLAAFLQGAHVPIEPDKACQADGPQTFDRPTSSILGWDGLKDIPLTF